MPELFPVELQDKFNQASFSYKIGDTAIESEVEVGMPKRRQRYTQAIDEVSGSIDLEIDDWTILETWYKTTLFGGVSTFYYNHPLTQVQEVYRFRTPPTLSPLGGRYFRVRFQWINIP